MLIQIKKTIINLNKVLFIEIESVEKGWDIIAYYPDGYTAQIHFRTKKEALEILNKIAPLQNTLTI